MGPWLDETKSGRTDRLADGRVDCRTDGSIVNRDLSILSRHTYMYTCLHTLHAYTHTCIHTYFFAHRTTCTDAEKVVRRSQTARHAWGHPERGRRKRIPKGVEVAYVPTALYLTMRYHSTNAWYTENMHTYMHAYIHPIPPWGPRMFLFVENERPMWET